MRNHPFEYAAEVFFAGLLGILLLSHPVFIQPCYAGTEPPLLTATERKALYQVQQAMAAKEYAAAEKIISSCLQNNPDDANYRIFLSLGNVLAVTGKSAQALEQYRNAVQRHPDDAALWQNMGKVYYDLKQYGHAGDSLARAYALTVPPSPSLGYQAAVAYILAARPEAARPLLEGLSAEDPGMNRSDWIKALLKVYLDLGQSGKALTFLREQMRYVGSSPKLWLLLTHLYIDRGEYGNAGAALEVKLSLCPGDPEEQWLLGDLYLMAGIPIMAARQYERMLGDNASAGEYEKTASAYLAARRPDKAGNVLHCGIERGATSSLWWLLASVHYENEEFEKAVRAYAKCLELDPRNAGAHLMMGYCLLQLNRSQDAREAFANAARDPRQRDEAQERIKEIDSLAGLGLAQK